MHPITLKYEDRIMYSICIKAQRLYFTSLQLFWPVPIERLISHTVNFRYYQVILCLLYYRFFYYS